MNSYIPSHLLPNLRKYKYSGADHSLVSKYLLQPYWNFIIQFIPHWMAPNLVTFIGFLFILFNVLLTAIYSPDLVSPLPRPLYFLFGINLFIYQSLDAIDGKQARRTGQSGPLGELFDHGCDALNTTLTVITIAPVFGFGRSWWILLSTVSTLTNFFLTTWEEYHTGVLFLGLFSGPVEGILVIVGIFFITGWYGPELWQITLPLSWGSITLMHCSLYFGLIMIILNSIMSIRNVLQVIKKTHKNNGSDPAPILLGLFPYIISVGLVGIWVGGNSEIILQSYILPLLLYITFTFGLLVGQIITSHVTHGPYPFFCINLYPAIIGACNVFIEFITGILIIPHNWDGMLIWISCLYSLSGYLHFAYDVINTICMELDIWCFTIQHPIMKNNNNPTINSSRHYHKRNDKVN